MNFKRLLVGLCALSFCFGMSACNRGSGKTRVAFVSNNNAAFWTIAERGTEKAAKEFDVQVEFRKPPAPGTAADQQRIVEDLMNTGIKGLAISPNDPKNLMAFLKNNVAAKIPFLTHDNDVPDPTVRRCYIGTHNYRAGRAAGALVARALPNGGKIAIFVGQSDAPNAIERRQGVLDFLAGKKQDEMTERDPFDATNLKVGEFVLLETKTDGTQEANCQKIAEDLLTRNPNVDCLIGLWEYNPPALLRAVEKSQLKTKPVIVGFDESYDTLKAIQKGTVVGTVVQDPFNFGYESVKILASLVKGDDSVLKNHKNIDKDNNIFIKHRVITKEAGDMSIDGQTVRTIFVDDFYAETKKLKGD